MRRDVEAIQEDARKVGTVLLGGGLIGVDIGADTIAFSEGIMLLMAGFAIGFFGITGDPSDGRL